MSILKITRGFVFRSIFFIFFVQPYGVLNAKTTWIIDSNIKEISKSKYKSGEVISREPLSDEDKDIIDQLIIQHVLPDDPFIVEVVKPEYGVNTEKLIKIKYIDGSRSIGKVFKALDAFKSEVSSLQAWNDLVKHIYTLKNVFADRLPILTTMLAEATVSVKEKTKGIIFFTRAYGETISHVINSLRNEKDVLSNDKIIATFETIGRQLGTQDALLFQRNNRKIFRNVDSNGGNFMFSVKKKQLYWIDTEQVIEMQIPYIGAMKLTHLYNFITDLNFNPNSDPLINREVNTFEEAQNMRNLISRFRLALKSVYTGYVNSIKKAGLDPSEIIREYDNIIAIRDDFDAIINQKIDSILGLLRRV